MIPQLVGAVGRLYGREIWSPPLTLPALIAKQQFLPLPLALGGLSISRILLSGRTPGVRTLVISNVNRHVGLALLLSAHQLHNQATMPAIACYALAAPLVIAVYARIAHRHGQVT